MGIRSYGLRIQRQRYKLEAQGEIQRPSLNNTSSRCSKQTSTHLSHDSLKAIIPTLPQRTQDLTCLTHHPATGYRPIFDTTAMLSFAKQKLSWPQPLLIGCGIPRKRFTDAVFPSKRVVVRRVVLERVRFMICLDRIRYVVGAGDLKRLTCCGCATTR